MLFPRRLSAGNSSSSSCSASMPGSHKFPSIWYFDDSFPAFERCRCPTILARNPCGLFLRGIDAYSIPPGLLLVHQNHSWVANPLE